MGVRERGGAERQRNRQTNRDRDRQTDREREADSEAGRKTDEVRGFPQMCTFFLACLTCNAFTVLSDIALVCGMIVYRN